MKGFTQREYYTQKEGGVHCVDCELVVNNEGTAAAARKALVTAPDLA